MSGHHSWSNLKPAGMTQERAQAALCSPPVNWKPSDEVRAISAYIDGAQPGETRSRETWHALEPWMRGSWRHEVADSDIAWPA